MTLRYSRRQFLMHSLVVGGLLGGVPGTLRNAHATGFAAVTQPMLANLMLDGGPDMRHLFMPAFSFQARSYGNTFWKARARVHKISDTNAALDQRWRDGYLPATSGNTTFGILARCGWLYDMWSAGKVAIICGVLGNSSRDHEQARRSLEMGDRTVDKQVFGNGWGGRLAYVANNNIAALTVSPRRFCFGPDPAAPADGGRVDLGRVVPAPDTRQIALPESAEEISGYDNRLRRALKHYYAAKRASVPTQSVYRQFFEQERKLRELGGAATARLATVPVPPKIKALFSDKADIGYDLALQTRNLYDTLAMHDILDARIASLEFGEGWDSHDEQQLAIEPSLAKLFGAQGALAALFDSLPRQARANLTLLIGGEFGRQLRDNGGNGTDHGEGTIMIVLGDQVRGGVYGTMFPEDEIARINEPSADIRGVNAIDHVFGAICDWMQPGSKALVFPNYATAPRELDLDLSTLFVG